MRRFIVAASLIPVIAGAQGTTADYERAARLNTRFQGIGTGAAETPEWIGATTRFWYRKTVKGGAEFVLVDAATKAKGPAFDHAKVAMSLAELTKEKLTAITLPFTTIDFVDSEKTLQFITGGGVYQCPLATSVCKRTGDAPVGGGGRGGRGRGGAANSEYDNQDDSQLMPSEGDGGESLRAAMALFQQQGGRGGATRSPDGRTEAYGFNSNIYLRPVPVAGATERPTATPVSGTPLTFDGVPGNAYDIGSLRWSPDSKRIFAYRVKPAQERVIHYVQSSPLNQLQPHDSVSRQYLKPGDSLAVRRPILFNLTNGRAIAIDTTLFPNAYTMGQPSWRRDGRGVVFDYNERGHMNYRVIEVDTAGRARAIINEETKSFFYYNAPTNNLDAGKHYKFDMNDGKETIWMSERDGWNHLYLYDGITGRVKNQITKGEWVVRNVERVDTVARQIYFLAGGMDPKQDPYFTNFYRINFDGTGLIKFTTANGTHALTWSSDRQFYIDSYSRVDMAPGSEVHRGSDGALVLDLEHGDLTELKKAGWSVPEVFVAKGRDGATDIWGVIYRPTNFNPAKKYPVIENIYAGPHGSFVPKAFSVNSAMRNLAELGFIVVQVDGMGTSNRSKAFHDVAWKNLKDAGFPDRILWHKAIAAKYPSYDIKRVGIYGTSAGGQSAMGALLFHPEFYKVAFSAAGCHDNRMDKIWWNEQWMGWPIGPQYVESSNMENAAKLQGKLMLVVGELDTNVDPSSTIQVVNALIKANKTFDFLYVPNADHGSGGPYGERKRNDFFVHNLLGVEGPDRNIPVVPGAGGRGRGGGGGR